MSDIDADHSRPRGRSTTLAVVLAVVFLAVLGGSVGVILGTQRGDGNNVANESTAPVSPGTTETESTPPNGNGTRPGTRPPGSTKSYPPTVKDDCPKQSDEAAGTDLSVKLYIRTRNSEVWICQGGGRTFYQGHNRNRPFPAATSDNSLFVPNPQFEAGVWRATNGGTVYFVSTERLRIERNGSEVANDPVEEFHEG